jgi:hypothetical protein
MDAIPIWSIFIGTTLIVIASIEVGYRVGRAVCGRSKGEKESPASVMSQSLLALAAFMLAFAFGVVANRFEARKHLVRLEANAIGTTWLRAEFLPERDRSTSRDLMREYVDVRVELHRSRNIDPENLQAVFHASDRTQSRLWEIAVENARKDLNSPVIALYVESLNEMFDIRGLRVNQGLRARIAGGIWVTLVSLLVMGMISVGYQTAIAASSRPRARAILAVSFALVISLIADLDRPGGGTIGVPYQPLTDLQNWMSSQAK